MAVGLFKLASVVGNGAVSSCTCCETADFWLADDFTTAADGCGKWASIENAADFFALRLPSKAVATDGGCDVLIFCMLKVYLHSQ